MNSRPAHFHTANQTLPKRHGVHVWENPGQFLTKENSTEGKAALTERENGIARLAAQGLSNKGIGKRLHISEDTVKTQLKRILAKLGINSRTLLKQKLEM